jgi:hypothetical protein
MTSSIKTGNKNDLLEREEEAVRESFSFKTERELKIPKVPQICRPHLN